MSDTSPKGRLAFVTGAGGGIGSAIGSALTGAAVASNAASPITEQTVEIDGGWAML